MSPTRTFPRIRLAALAALVILGASACKVVRFDYGTVDPIPPWDANALAEYELGPGYYVEGGTLYTPTGEEVPCASEDQYIPGYWSAFGMLFSPDGPLYCA